MSNHAASSRGFVDASRHAALPKAAREVLHLGKRLHFLSRHGAALWRQATAKAPRTSNSERLRQLLAGFDPLEASWYMQARGHVGGCVSNLHREEYLKGVNGAFGHVLDNKHLFAVVAERLGVAHPKLFALARGGKWRWLEDGREALEREFSGGGRAVLKPTTGKKGLAVSVIRDMSALERGTGADMIVSAFVQQGAYARSIHPGSLNTIRLLTIRPGSGEQAFVAAAIHRFGGVATGPVDNFSAGGLVAEVDLESGRMSEAAQIGMGNTLLFRPDHPDSGVRIEGVQVPFWEQAKALVLHLCEMLPYLDYVGWDVAITEQGPVVIEGNSHPSLRFFQIYRSLLTDARVAAFLAARAIKVSGGPA
jgi:hypothetical protein